MCVEISERQATDTERKLISTGKATEVQEFLLKERAVRAATDEELEGLKSEEIVKMSWASA